MSPREYVLLIVSFMAVCCLGQTRAAVLVVDPAAPGAADENPGSEQQPFKTVQRTAEVARAGDTVCVMAGRYNERVVVKTGGSEGRSIVFRAMPRRSASIGGFELNASYVRVEGFEITADKPVTAIRLGGSHCEVLDNYIHDMMEGVVGTGGDKRSPSGRTDYSTVAHHRIAFNRVYHCEYGFLLLGEDWLVENNEVERLFMYAPGRGFDDCDYTRFFGKCCVQRGNYYHGSRQPEIKTAHVDCLQTFPGNGGAALDVLFENNVCFDFHQMCMVEKLGPNADLRRWTFRGNIASTNAPTMRGGWGPDIIRTADVTLENNTLSTVNWSTIGLRDKESVNGQIRNNILCDAERAVVDGDETFSPARPLIEYNLTFKTAALAGNTNVNGRDPLFVDAPRRNFRLRKGSPAIAAGKDCATAGALEYPNVYYVDPRHPAASDEPAWGYPAVPLKTLAKAMQTARSGETVVLRGGVYRETLRPGSDGVTVRAMRGEPVTISGADVIEGWQRTADGSWSAALVPEPKRILRDGRPWTRFRYDTATKRILVATGGDPRLHLFETVVRQRGIEPADQKNVRVVEIAVVNTLAGR